MLRPLLLAMLLCAPGLSAKAVMPAWYAASPGDAPPYAGTETPSRSSYTPVVVNSLPDISYSLTAGSFTIDLTEVFEDTDGEALSFSAVSNRTGIATVTVSGNILTVTPQSLGTCRIRATARDNNNGKADDTFTLTVNSNQPPSFTPEAEFNKRVLFFGADPIAIDLSLLFFDPDGDNLVYTAESEDEDVADTDLDGATLEVSPGEPGETRIALSANDQNGGIILASFVVEVVLQYPASMAVDVGIEFDDYRDQGNYRLLALPGNQSVFLGNIIDGEHGEDWVAYAPDTSNTGRLIPFDRSPSFVLNPGSGLWLISKTDWEQRDILVPTVPLGNDGTIEIPLREGWNIISNPLDQDIPWTTVANYNGVSQDLWRWRQGYRVVDTFFSTANEPEAFYFNNVEGIESLKLPYIFPGRNLNKTGIPGEQTQHVSAQTTLSLAATHEATGISSQVAIVHTPEAETGFDLADRFAPPSYFDSFSLRITPTHPDFTQQKLAVEARASSQDVQQYDLELSTPATGAITLQLTGSLEDDVVLVNRLDTKQYRLKEVPNPLLHLEQDVTPFTLLIGNQDAVDEALRNLKPSIYSLKPNFPNPFGTRTTIAFSLPEAEYVDLRVFDLMGRHVTTLYQGDQEAGLHSVQWNGLDQYQHPVANGVYFYRLQTRTWTHTRKMTLIR